MNASPEWLRTLRRTALLVVGVALLAQGFVEMEWPAALIGGALLGLYESGATRET